MNNFEILFPLKQIFPYVSVLDPTAGFLIHGRRARIFGQIFDQIFGQVFDQGFWLGFWTRKYSVQYYGDEKIQLYSTTGTEKSLGKNHVIKNPISLKIPYIKNLAVRLLGFLLFFFVLLVFWLIHLDLKFSL